MVSWLWRTGSLGELVEQLVQVLDGKSVWEPGETSCCFDPGAADPEQGDDS